MMSPSRLQLGALLVFSGCQGVPDEPPVIATSRYLEFASSVDFELCPVNLERLDGFIEAVYADLDESPPEGLLARYNYVPDRWDEYCSNQACTCPANDCPPPVDRDIPTIFTGQFLQYHELAHAVHLDILGTTGIAFLDEGFAERYRSLDGIDSTSGTLDDPFDIQEQINSDDPDVTFALAFANATVERHGMAIYKAFLGQAARSDREDLDAIFEALTSETMQETIDASYSDPICDLQLALCTSAPMPLTDSPWTVPAAPGCSTDSLALSGPDKNPSSTRREHRYTFQVGSPTIRYRIEKPIWADVEIIPCGQPCSNTRLSHTILRGTESWEVPLFPGNYELKLLHDDTYATSPATVTIAPSTEGGTQASEPSELH